MLRSCSLRKSDRIIIEKTFFKEKEITQRRKNAFSEISSGKNPQR